MKKPIMIFFLLSLWSISCLGTAKTRCPEDRLSQMAVKLRAYSVLYNLNDVERGSVKFAADLTNNCAIPLAIVHPSRYRAVRTATGGGCPEIRLTIVRADGRKVVLRDCCRLGFDPGNLWCLELAPGETRSFDLGWFFQNARGRWENDAEAAAVFMQPGEYRIRLHICSPDSKPEFLSIDDCRGPGAIWAGEMASEEISIRVQ